MATSAANENRLFARRMAQELTGDEMARVAGGDPPNNDTPDGSICWYCEKDPGTGKDDKLLGIDP